MDDDESVVRMNLARVDASTLVRREPLVARSELVRALGLSAEKLLALSGVRHYAAGATIYVTGAEADRVYLVARGEVTLLSSPGADATPLLTLHPGDCFGAGAALEQATRVLTARVGQTADLVEIPSEHLRRAACQLPPLQSFLESVHARFEGQKTELDDFLNRW